MNAVTIDLLSVKTSLGSSMYIHSKLYNEWFSCFSVHSDTVPIHPGIRVHVIIGASTGCSVVILLILILCTVLCIVRKLCKKQRHNVEHMGSLYADSEFQHKPGEFNHGTNIPQYETISPLYDVIPDNNTDHSEIYLRMMSNNAYSESAKCIQ